jgi:hypothetical protein
MANPGATARGGNVVTENAREFVPFFGPLGDSQNNLPVHDRRANLIGNVAGSQQSPFLMAGGAGESWGKSLMSRDRSPRVLRRRPPKEQVKENVKLDDAITLSLLRSQQVRFRESPLNQR